MKAICQKRLVSALGVALLSAVPGIGFSASSMPAYTPVTQSRLENGTADGNWLQYRGNYSGWDYSPLDQISADNVSNLKLVWSFTTGQQEAHEGFPAVNNGYMFITTADDQVIALNATTGQELWRYKYPIPPQEVILHPTNRGVALWGDNVYMATADCKLVSLNATTGKVNWTVNNGNWKDLYYATLAPLAVKGKIIMGCSGGETGIRGSITAYDAKTGKRDWRFWTVPAPNQPGGNTWPDDTYKHGGGPIWITGSYDPNTNTTFWGIGNPAPWLSSKRRGANLYTDSVVALDVKTGKLKAYFQYTPHGDWDWDEISTPMLIDVEHDGKTNHEVVHASRSGFIYQLTNAPGPVLKFISATPFANNNVITGFEKDGSPIYSTDKSKFPGIGHTSHYCPSAWGGKDWWPEAWSPKTKLLYVPANTTMCGSLPPATPRAYVAGKPYILYPLTAVLNSIRFPNGKPSHIGQLQAWDLSTNKMVWKHNFKSQLFGPTTVTGGNLVFVGGTTNRMFRAFDAKTGKLLWEYPTPSGVEGTPVAFKVNGVEYIAVLSGWGVDAQRTTLAINKQLHENVVVPEGGTLLVFALKNKASPR